MKKEFSFYEFVGIITPSTIFLYGANLIIVFVYQKQFVDFSKIGETAVFLIISYGFGHLLQAFGNIFEDMLWSIYDGKPTKWLTNKNRFGKWLFENSFNQKVAEKVKQKYGDDLTDYGRITYNTLFQMKKNDRIDIFNGNYSLFRGLAVSFLFLSILCFYFVDIKFGLLAVATFVLAVLRMIRFAKYYATETFTTFYNLVE